jgi:hypothetical protein
MCHMIDFYHFPSHSLLFVFSCFIVSNNFNFYVFFKVSVYKNFEYLAIILSSLLGCGRMAMMNSIFVMF